MSRNINRYIPLGLAVTLAMLALVVILGSPEPACAQNKEKADTITSVFVPGTIQLRVGDPAWARTKWARVTMGKVYRQPKEPISEFRSIYIKSVNNGTDIFFRFRWYDPTKSVKITDTDLFADAVAVGTTLSGMTTVPPAEDDMHMGATINPVNIWYWRADLKVPQNIVAGSKGTVQMTPDRASQNIRCTYQWSKKYWDVVMARSMLPASQNHATFQRGTTIPISFAFWEGGIQERNGNKFANEFFWDKLIIK